MSGDRSGRADLPIGDVTFLFTDIEGSTRLLVELGDGYEALQDLHAVILRRAIGDHRGVEVNTEGDAFFAAFASAADAVAAAVAGQRDLARAAWSDDHEIRVRMGLHSGAGRLGGDDYVGLDVNRAARIASAAHGGQIVVSAATADLVEGRLDDLALTSLGRHRLKDLPDAIELWQVEAPGLATAFPTLRTLDARLTNLPPDAADVVGRDGDIARVRSLLVDRREVTLTGPGGTGKTRLAQAVGASLADDCPDGVMFVEVEEAVDRPGVTSAIARTLGIHERPDRDLEASVFAYLADRAVLIILDNFEQAIEAAPIVSDLLAASPGSRIIVTSRAVLRIRDEQEVPVEPLAIPASEAAPADDIRANPAVALFLGRARQVRAGFDPSDDEMAAIAAICRQLDGLPLAIELAAARIRMLSPIAILGRLDRALPLLRGGGRDRPERQQTITSAIDWSYDLLEEDERRLLAALSVFAGGWTLEAAEQVCGEATGIDVFDGLASLAEKSLVRTADGPDGEPRFSMLAVIHEYATARADADPRTEDIAARHATWVAEFVEATGPELVRRELGRHQRRLYAEEENIRAALRRTIAIADATTAARISGWLWRFWHFWGGVREGIDWLTQATELPQDGVPAALRASVRTSLGSLYYWIGRIDEAEAHYQAALELRQLGVDPLATADAWYDLAFTAAASGRGDESRARFATARAGYSDIDDAVGVARLDGSVAVLAYSVFGDGSYEDAVAAVDLVLEVTDRAGALHDWIAAQSSIIFVHRAAGRPDLAQEAFRRAAAATLEAGDLGHLAEILKVAAAFELELGRPERAVVLAAASARHAGDIGGNLGDSYYSTDVAGTALAALGDEAYAAAEARGHAMSLTEATEYAIASTET